MARPHKNRKRLGRNALRGTITTWCPACHRRGALGAVQGGLIGQHQMHATRTCRYCGHAETGNEGKRLALYKIWAAERIYTEHCGNPPGFDARIFPNRLFDDVIRLGWRWSTTTGWQRPLAVDGNLAASEH